MFAALAGLAAGFLHVVSGPDHLAAVAPLATDARRTAWRSGFTWGLGHTAGVLVVGLLLIAFRELLPLDALSSWSERIVGAALVGVGLWALWQARRVHVHRHDGGTPHVHVASGRSAPLPAAAHDRQHRAAARHAHGGASFGMGLLHGLAGSSHVFGVLPSLAFAARSDAVQYLAGFGVGAVAAMTAFAAVIGAVALASGGAGRALRQAMLYVTATAAIVVGGVWLFVQ